MRARGLLCAFLPLAAGCSDRVVEAIRAPAAIDGGAPRQTCAEIFAADPAASDGTYVIDPDGPGANPPVAVFCDRAGGWTRATFEDFSAPTQSFSKNTITTCGGFGSILGGHRILGNETITATIDLKGIPHRELRLRFEFVALDSWDAERAFADVDGTRVWSKTCDKTVPATCNHTTDQCGWDGRDRVDGKVSVDVITPHTRPHATITIGAVLDQSTADESWGIDDFAILVR